MLLADHRGSVTFEAGGQHVIRARVLRFDCRSVAKYALVRASCRVISPYHASTLPVHGRHSCVRIVLLLDKELGVGFTSRQFVGSYLLLTLVIS